MNVEATADAVRQWLKTVYEILPQSLFDIFETIYCNAIYLAERCASLTELSLIEAIDSINLQTLLPPLISFLAIYFAIVSLYHTTTFFVRTTVFLVKWGVLIGAMGAAFGYFANTFMQGSLGVFNPNTKSKNPFRPSRSRRPRVWDTFEEHQRWRDAQREETPHMADAGRVAREIIEKIVDATQQTAGSRGLWQKMTGLAVKSVMGDEAVKEKPKAKNVRGKGKSR